MASPGQHGMRIFGSSLRAAIAALAIVLVFSAIPTAQAQTFNVIHVFDGTTGSVPEAGLVLDRAGNLYGTTRDGGDFYSGYRCQLYQQNGCGVVFKLSRHGSDWLFATLYKFHGSDGGYPEEAVTLGPDGTIYGSTGLGGPCTEGAPFGCGTIFHITVPVTRPASLLQPWPEKVLYNFYEGDDGGPYPSEIVFYSASNIYGTTVGGTYSAGNIFEMTPLGSGWTESVVYSFLGGTDGLYPHGVVFDSAGNLYGATRQGGNYDCSPYQGCGTIYELTPSPPGWTKTVLHVFDQNSEGGGPGHVILDQAGNIYGATRGAVNPGIIWELSPSNGSWTFNVLYRFTGYNDWGPEGRLTMDTAGNLYGVSYGHGPSNYGEVFKLSPSNGSWTYTDLYDFQGGIDGCNPEGFVTLDASGNIYGTASGCGADSVGTVWEITP